MIASLYSVQFLLSVYAPVLPVRGYMLDISRDKVPTMETLFALVDSLAALRYNQLQFYTEHTFAFADDAPAAVAVITYLSQVRPATVTVDFSVVIPGRAEAYARYAPK